jgi:hypothetical protein
MSEDPSGSAESLKNKFVNKMQKQIEANQRSQKDDDDDEVLSRCHPHFVQFKNSKKYHTRSGACTTEARTDNFGPLLLREAFCACARCFVFDFRNCLVQEHVGRVQTAEVSRKTGAPAVSNDADSGAVFVRCGA